ncbi:hypothetical protein H5P28_19020 [Ruficoccus amylovorans]|uniref:PEP-CTERM protein-sorting domain-containing protein n=1 Tax=Ruficoccus amylovorans TaxID=1804625 RepID=A0A842HHX2_9BACT|nr:hypothetical protein [Ruficoccus amylovorans]MBC2596365.1 hypothetical protein [Ruficoccus amylovorans]
MKPNSIWTTTGVSLLTLLASLACARAQLLISFEALSANETRITFSGTDTLDLGASTWTTGSAGANLTNAIAVVVPSGAYHYGEYEDFLVEGIPWNPISGFTPEDLTGIGGFDASFGKLTFYSVEYFDSLLAVIWDGAFTINYSFEQIGVAPDSSGQITFENIDADIVFTVNYAVGSAIPEPAITTWLGGLAGLLVLGGYRYRRLARSTLC